MNDINALFVEYFINDPLDSEGYLNDCMDLLHGFAQEKGIEFDGYFQERWEDAADTIVNFDEDYFENRDRKNLYVFLSALYDDEVFDYLQSAYTIAKLEAPTQEWVKLQVDGLIAKGLRFWWDLTIYKLRSLETSESGGACGLEGNDVAAGTCV